MSGQDVFFELRYFREALRTSDFHLTFVDNRRKVGYRFGLNANELVNATSLGVESLATESTFELIV